MLHYIARRVAIMIPLVVVISIISFIIIELPPGDFVTMRIMQLRMSGTEVADDEIQKMVAQYGLDRPLPVRYAMWVGGIIRHGNFGRSFQWQQPVAEVIAARLPATMLISLLSLILAYGVAIPIGIYSAVHKYSAPDVILTFLGFIGLSVPPFLLALVIVYLAYAHLNIAVTGLFSPEFANAAFSLAKLADLLKRIWIPIVIVGLSGTASIIRVMRGCLLDELKKQYMVTGRAKGVPERRLLYKYAVRVAINPIASTIGWLLPQIVSGTPLVAIVLNLPTLGPVLLRALLYQDMYLAGSIVLILGVLTLIGTLVSDILLAALDPRIRFEKRANA